MFPSTRNLPWTGPRPGTKEWMRVVGVIRDDRHYGLEQPPRGTVFFPHRAAGLTSMTMILRAWAEPESLVAPSREILRQANPDLPMFEVRTMMERVNRSLWVRRGYSWLFGLFATVALMLAAAGIYGVVSYAVNQRTREIGIRMALGAQPGQVLRSILGGGMLLVAVGAAAGLAAALTTAHLIEKLLFGVKAKDPVIYVAVVLGIAGVGLLANWIPARRAAAVDPMRALRTE